MRVFKKLTISKGKSTTIVVLTILLIVIFFLNIISAPALSADTKHRSFLARTVDQIGDTVTLVRNYARSVFTGDPFNAPSEETSSTEGDTKEEGDSTLALSPPTIGGTTSILSSVISRLEVDKGLFIINTNLKASGDLDVAGSANVSDITVAGKVDTGRLTVREVMESLGLLSALGGIRTGGADINLEGGDILGLDFVRSIVAGENVEITESGGVVTISVPNASKRSGGGGGGGVAGVSSLNGQTGALTLTAGTDILITGLTIENTSTLASVRLRGGCAACILDGDVADDLTITGGVINDTIIGASNPAAGYFTSLSIGTGGGGPALNVTGGAAFTGTVSGADAVNTNEFVTLSQLNSAVFGGGGGVSSLNSLVGAISIAGTAGQVTVTPSGSTITLTLPQSIATTDSPTFGGLTLNGLLSVTGNVIITGDVTANRFVSAATDATVRKTGEEIFRVSTSIFPFALPAETGSASFVRISKEFTSVYDNPIASDPTPIPGTTRIYKFVIKYADSIPTPSVSSWRIYKPSTTATIDTFTISGQNKTSLEEPEIVITDPITIPTGDWEIDVSVPSGRIRVMDIHMLAFDVVN